MLGITNNLPLTFMVKRFNNLDAALKYLRPTGATEGTPVPDAPAGTPLAKYQDYKAGKVDLDYPRASGSLPGEINIVVVKPFALPSADTTALRTTLSGRSQGQFSTYGLTDAELGIDITLQDTDKEVAALFRLKQFAGISLELLPHLKQAKLPDSRINQRQIHLIPSLLEGLRIMLHGHSKRLL